MFVCVFVFVFGVGSGPMRHVVIHKPGGYERLRIEEAADPRAGPGEVAVEVEAIGVNYADCVVRMGLYTSAKHYVGWPITPGFEVAGRTADGDDVIAVTLFGGYASRVVVPADQVFPRPGGWTVEEAAGFPTVFLTAWYALIPCAAVEKGQTVLVHSAAGGVGGALLQLAKIAGARSVGVVGGAHKVEAARALGADAVIDKSSEDLWAAAERHAPEGYHAVFDANGIATLKASYAHVRPAGRLVVYGHHSMLPKGKGRPNWPVLAWKALRVPRFNPLEMGDSNRSVMAFNLSYLFDEKPLLARAMGELLGWAAEGRLRPPTTTSYPLANVAEAHRALETGETVGKLVLVP